MIKNKLKQQVVDLQRINDKIESIINHKNRHILDDIILDYVIIQRNKIEMIIETSKYSLTNSDNDLLESIYDTNDTLDIKDLESKLDRYIELLEDKNTYYKNNIITKR